MKCPKCGYNSFEIHDTCKKCANDLTGYKETHGLKSIVLPQETRAEMAEKLMAEMPREDQAAVAEVPADMFSFDIPENAAAAVGNSSSQGDPFNFGDELASPAEDSSDFSFGTDQPSARDEEESFGDLLESSPQLSEPVSAAETQDAPDLDGFSWDDKSTAAPGDAAKPDDDFNSLFGETDDSAKK